MRGWPDKLRLSKNVTRHIERVFRDAGWSDAGSGWEGWDGALCLSGWGKRAFELRAGSQRCRRDGAGTRLNLLSEAGATVSNVKRFSGPKGYCL